MLTAKARRLIGRIAPRWATVHASDDYVVLNRQAASRNTGDGWRDPSVAERQDAAYRRLIDEMYDGRPREDFKTAADAIRSTGLINPRTLEVGCGSGYYKEILTHLLEGRICYAGMDYSEAMIRLAWRRYRETPFFVGDATALPCADHAFDVVLNSVSLMHILRYGEAIAESRRVARYWCVFHTVPILLERETTVLRKNAYGRPTVEIIFNEGELLELFRQNGLNVQHTFGSIAYDLRDVLREPTSTKTYVCKCDT